MLDMGERGAGELGDWGAENRARGLDPGRERELLARLR
jgi:hypothetical protein